VGVSASRRALTIVATRPPVAAFERERSAVERELLWALVAMQADSYQHESGTHARYATLKGR